MPADKKTYKEISGEWTEKYEKEKLTEKDVEKEKERATFKIDKKVEEVKDRNETIVGKETPQEKEDLEKIEKEAEKKGEESKEKIKLASEKGKEVDRETLKREIEELIKIDKYGLEGRKIDREMIQAEIEEREKRIQGIEREGVKPEEAPLVPPKLPEAVKKEGEEIPALKPEKEKEEKKPKRRYSKEDLIKIAEILGKLPEEVREKYEKQCLSLKEKVEKQTESLEKKAENLQKKYETLEKKGKLDQAQKAQAEYLKIKEQIEKIKKGEIPAETSKEIEDALKKLESYNPVVIERAFKAVEAREKTAEEYATIVKDAKEHKMSKENVLEKTEVGSKFKEIRKDYIYYLKDLKVALAYSKTEEQKQRIAEKLREKEEELKEQDMPPEKIKGVLGAFLADLEKDKIESLKYYEANVLWPLLNDSEKRLQRDIYKVLSQESEKTANRFTNILKAYNKLPRPLKAALVAGAIGAGMVTGGLLVGVPAYALAVPAAYRVLRGVTGGTVAGVLEKYVTQPIMGKIYKARKEAITNEIRKEILSGKYSAEIEECIKSEDYGKWWGANQKIFEENRGKFDKLEKSHKTRSWVAAIGTGIAGGMIGGMAFDRWIGPHIFLSPAGIGESPVQVGVKETEQIAGGPSPDSVVHQGEGIEHAYIRQLTNQPEKFGFQGDLNNEAAVRSWAENSAHRLAIEHGYVNPATGDEIRVAIPGEAAYQLNVDAQNQIITREWFAGQPVDPDLAKGLNVNYEYLHKTGSVLAKGPGETLTRVSLEGDSLHFTPLVGGGEGASRAIAGLTPEQIAQSADQGLLEQNLQKLGDLNHFNGRTLGEISNEWAQTNGEISNVVSKLNLPTETLPSGRILTDISSMPGVLAASENVRNIFEGGREFTWNWLGISEWQWQSFSKLKISDIMQRGGIGGDYAEISLQLKNKLAQSFSQSMLKNAGNKSLWEFFTSRVVHGVGSGGNSAFGMFVDK